MTRRMPSGYINVPPDQVAESGRHAGNVEAVTNSFAKTGLSQRRIKTLGCIWRGATVRIRITILQGHGYGTIMFWMYDARRPADGTGRGQMLHYSM